MERPAILRRYTNLASLMHILEKKQITLLDPSTWDDYNDVKFIDWYREKSGAKSVYALCFTEKKQTYHHWKVFSNGSDGVCIEFAKKGLLEAIEKQNSKVQAKDVIYKSHKDLDDFNVEVSDLPFLKRVAYQDEKEFRLFYSSHKKQGPIPIDIDTKIINRIILNPWMAKPLADVVKKQINTMKHNADFRIIQSRITDSRSWQYKVRKMLKD